MVNRYIVMQRMIQEVKRHIRAGLRFMLEMMDSANAVKSDDKQNQWKIMIMNTSGRKHGHKWEQIQYKRQQIVMKALSKEDPSIVLFQECPCENFEQHLQEDKALGRYKYKGHAEGASMIYKEDIFNVEDLSPNTINNILSSKNLAGEKSEILKKILSAEFMYISKVNLKNDLDINFLCVSWHGPHKETPSKKIKYFTYFVEFLVYLQKEIGKEKEGKTLPILVGGNFNIDINDAKFETEETKKLFFLTPYKVSARKIPFNGMKASCKDFFVATKDLKLKTIGCMDLKEIKDHVSPETIIDHHPVLGYLSLSNYRPGHRSETANDLLTAMDTDDQTILNHATNVSNMCTTHGKTDSQNDTKPLAKPCKSPIMIMNTGRAPKAPSGIMTPYRRMQFIKTAVLKELPSIVLFQEFPLKNFKEDLTWKKDKILSRYIYNGNNGKACETGMMYNEDMCVVKELPQEIEHHLRSLFKENVKNKFKEKIRTDFKNKLPTYLEPAERMSILQVKTLSEPYIKCVCVSWHGPNDILDDEKIDYLKCFMKFLHLLHKDMELPILVGGDFNINIDNKAFETEVEKEFCIWRYEAPKRRQSLPISPKRGRKSGLIDFFITTKELQLQEIGFMDLSELEDFLSPENIFSRDPVVGHLRWNKSKMPVKKYVENTTEDVLPKFVQSTGNSEGYGKELGGRKMSGGRGRISSMRNRSGGYPRRERNADTDIDYSHNDVIGMREHPYSGNEYGRSHPYSLPPDDRRRGFLRDSLPMPRNYDIYHYEGPLTDYNRDYDGYDDPARHPTGTTLSYSYNRHYQHTMGWEPPGPTSQGHSSLYSSDRDYEPNPSKPWYYWP